MIGALPTGATVRATPIPHSLPGHTPGQPLFGSDAFVGWCSCGWTGLHRATFQAAYADSLGHLLTINTEAS